MLSKNGKTSAGEIYIQEPHLFLPISRNDIPRNAVTVFLPTPPFWLQTATFVIPWIVYGRFYFGKLTPCAEKLRAVREPSTQWVVCWLSDMVDLVPISLAVLHTTSVGAESRGRLFLPAFGQRSWDL